MKYFKYFVLLLLLVCASKISMAEDINEEADNDQAEWDSKSLSDIDASKFLETYKRLLGHKDEEIREDNNELGERRSEAFEAYEEKCEPVLNFGKRACPHIKECGANFQQNAFNNYDPTKKPDTTKKPKYQQVIDNFFWRRELANEFQRALFKRKHDAEEIREIDAKVEARRKKAYENYEDSCKIHGKFEVRTCPKLEECYAKNKLKFVPLKSNNSSSQSKLTHLLASLSTTTTTKSTTLTKPKRFGRELLERAIALNFLRNQNLDDENDDDDDDQDSTSDLGEIARRFLFKDKNKNKDKKPPINPELVEETKERKNKAFKKYEEYCEKRKFRIGAQRNCPALNKDLC